MMTIQMMGESIHYISNGSWMLEASYLEKVNYCNKVYNEIITSTIVIKFTLKLLRQLL